MILLIRPKWPLPSTRLPKRSPRPFESQSRCVSAGTLRYRTPPRPLPPPPQYRTKEAIKLYREQSKHLPDIPPAPKNFKVHPAPGKAGKTICPAPLDAWNQQQLAVLDPTNARTRLFSESNEDAARVGDVLMVRFRSGDPFAGVCMNLKRRGIESSILLRNHLMRVGTEMSVKIYSPTVTGIEIVERMQKRPRRGRLYYLRKPEHDRGSLDGLVERYMKNKMATGRGAAKRKSKATNPKAAAPAAATSAAAKPAAAGAGKNT